MKKSIIFAFLLLFAIGFVIAEETGGVNDEQANQIGEEAQQIQDVVDQAPITEDGQIDQEKITGFKSKAEERIDKINQWMEDNASWMKMVFTMVPEISWLFAFVLYFWLLFFVNLVLNGNVFQIAIDNENIARGIGAAIFVFLLLPIPPLTHPILRNIATWFYNFWDFVWNKFLPAGMVVAVIVMIILAIVLIALAIFAPQILLAIKKKIDEAREKKKQAETDTNRKELGNYVEGINEGSK